MTEHSRKIHRNNSDENKIILNNKVNSAPQNFPKRNSDENSEEKYLVARLEMGDKTLEKIADIASNKVSKKVASEACMMLARNVIKNDKLEEQCKTANEKVNNATSIAEKAKREEMNAKKEAQMYHSIMVISMIVGTTMLLTFKFFDKEVVNEDLLGNNMLLKLILNMHILMSFMGNVMNYYFVFFANNLIHVTEILYSHFMII
jgi:hypothetical protein